MQIFFILKHGKAIKTFPKNIEIKSILNFLKIECLNNGSSLKGRIESFNFLTNSKQKSCILISMEKRILLMPLYSLHYEENILLNFFMIDEIKYKNYNKTVIKFINGTQIELDINNRVVKKQYKRCDIFLKKLCYN